MITPEIVPFAKTGGLADMTGSLVAALEKLGAEISVIIPAHRSVLQQRASLQDTGIRLGVPISNRIQPGAVLKGPLGPHISIYAIQSDRYFDRESLYGTADGDYADNAERFVFFSRSSLQLLSQMGAGQVIDVTD